MRFLVLRPLRIQAWREADELPGRTRRAAARGFPDPAGGAGRWLRIDLPAHAREDRSRMWPCPPGSGTPSSTRRDAQGAFTLARTSPSGPPAACRKWSSPIGGHTPGAAGLASMGGRLTSPAYTAPLSEAREARAGHRGRPEPPDAAAAHRQADHHDRRRPRCLALRHRARRPSARCRPPRARQHRRARFGFRGR